MRWLALAAVVIVGIQFIPVERSNPPAPNDLDAPAAVSSLLRGACYDCHSNQTRWPWYAAAAPISWLVAREVNEGRRRLNFSQWDSYISDPETARHKLDQIAGLVMAGMMAPRSYRILHRGARLTAVQRRLIARWAHHEAARLPNWH